MAVEVTLKRWGNSVGVVLPRELIEERMLKENQKIMIEVVKIADLTNLFGSLKLKKQVSGQKIKDMARKGWESQSDRRRWKK